MAITSSVSSELPNSDTSLLDQANLRAQRYLAGLADRSVAPTPQAIAALERFNQPLGDAPTSPNEVLAMLDDVGSPGTL